MAKGEARREGSGCGGRDGAGCGERGDASAVLCQAASCGSCGLQSAHDWEGEGAGGGPTLEPTTSLSVPSLPPAPSVPLSLLHPHRLVPAQASSSFPGPLPPPSLLLASVHPHGGPQRILSTPRVNPIPPLLTHLPWLPSAPGQRPSPSAWRSTVAHQSPRFHLPRLHPKALGATHLVPALSQP